MLPWRALVVGCAKYDSESLQCSLKDAEIVFTSFQTCTSCEEEHDQVLLTDPCSDELQCSIDRLVRPPTRYKRMFLYFAGHSYERNGLNYLQPGSRGPSSSPDICLQTVKARLEKDSLLFVVHHGCRNQANPGMVTPQSLRPSSPKRVLKSDYLIIFSCLSGEATLDDTPFAKELASLLSIPGLELESLLQMLKVNVPRHRVEAHVSLSRTAYVVPPRDGATESHSPEVSVEKVCLPSRLSGAQLVGFKTIQCFHKNGDFEVVRDALNCIQKWSRRKDDVPLAQILQGEEHHFNAQYNQSLKCFRSIADIALNRPESFDNSHGIVAISISWSVAALNRLSADAATHAGRRARLSEAISAMQLASCALQQMSSQYSDPIIEAEVQRHWGQLASRLLDTNDFDLLLETQAHLPSPEPWRSVSLKDATACRDYLVRMGMSQCTAAAERYQRFGIFDDVVKCTVTWGHILLSTAHRDDRAIHDCIARLEAVLQSSLEGTLTSRTSSQALLVLALAYRAASDAEIDPVLSGLLLSTAMSHTADARARSEGRALGDHKVAVIQYSSLASVKKERMLNARNAENDENLPSMLDALD